MSNESDERARRAARAAAREAARAWGFTYEIYLLHYLNSGPVTFGQRTPVTRPSVPPSKDAPTKGGAAWDLLSDPIAELRKEYALQRDVYKSAKSTERLPWTGELEFALRALEKLHRASPDGLGEYLKLCAWQVVQNTRSFRDRIGIEGGKALAYLEEHYSSPYHLNDWSQLGDARISDEQSELRIASGEYPQYTYQVTVDRPFSEVCSVIDQSQRWQRDACGRLLGLGPAISDFRTYYRESYQNDMLTLDFDFPVRVQPDEDDWTGENATVSYRTDLSKNNSSLRLDFSLVKSDSEDRLLEEDSGYYLIRKSLAKVGRSDLIVQRSLWFSNRAFGMNAALRPLFKMIVDHRVLGEFAELCRKPDDTKPDDTGSRATDPPPVSYDTSAPSVQETRRTGTDDLSHAR